jgi:hypothetical protein
VGQIDEFLVNSDGQITHLVLRTGHLWGQKDISIPVSEIAHFSEQKVTLKLDKAQIKALPIIAIRR